MVLATRPVAGAAIVTRAGLDVAAVDTHGFGPRSTLWWGVLTLLSIEGMGMVMVGVGLLYYRQNFAAWPPAGTPPPGLAAAVANTALLLVSVAPMALTSMAARRFDRLWTGLGFALLTVIGGASCVLRGFELAALNCRWDDHAYGSAVWLLVGMHFAHLIGATVENALLTAAIFGPVEPKHYVDGDSNAFYWYFVVGTWLPIFALVYLWPRVA
jgi:heme/copper-type cytochrome/quinol oxidase subunit 3